MPVNYVYRVLQLQKELDSVMSNGWKLEQLLDLPVSVGVKPRLNFCVSPSLRRCILLHMAYEPSEKGHDLEGARLKGIIAPVLNIGKLFFPIVSQISLTT